MVAIWFLGQASVVIRSETSIIYIDPFLTDYVDERGQSKRRFPPPFCPEEVTDANIVMSTHDHIDHLDPGTLGPLSKSSPYARFVVPRPHISRLIDLGIEGSRIIGAAPNDPINISDAQILPIAAAHEEYAVDQNGDSLYLGYVITTNGMTIYHAGDTMETPCLTKSLKEHHIDIAFLPINGADWRRRRRGTIGNMNPREAADVAAETNVQLVIPVHYDLFRHNGENPAHFVSYMVSQYPDRRFKIMIPGERILCM
jgi:L-ascorbate 6-phosphate lactonase